MKTLETEYLGGGVYLRFDGINFLFMANHPEHPTDTVYLDKSFAPILLRLIRETINDDEGGR